MTQARTLYLKTALYSLTRVPLKDTVMNYFDLCGRNGVRVTARKCKSWGKVTSFSHLTVCADLPVLRNPEEGSLRSI